MPRPGRPRSELSRCRILETALRLARTKGYSNITMDEIAAEAGAGKQTIYRWWDSKADVVLDALKQNAKVEIEVPDSGSLQQDLSGFLSNTFAAQNRRPGLTRVLQAMMAEAQRDKNFAESFLRDFIEPRRQTLRGIFARAHSRGQIPDLNGVQNWIDVAFGVMWYRLLLDVGPLDDTLAQDLALLLSATAGAGRKGAT
jgi:AcrR family transcriptional regulator